MLRLAEHPEALGSLTIAEIDPAFVQAFLDGLSDRPATQEQARKALQALEKWAVVRRRLPRQITLGTEVLGSQGAREPWSEEEVAIAEHCGRPDLERTVTLGANTGQRLGDMCRMRWADVRVYRGRLGIDLTQEKTKKPLWVPVIQEFEPVFSSWERNSLWILTRRDGRPWTRPELSEAWYRERLRNPLLAPLNARKLSLHGLRATATILTAPRRLEQCPDRRDDRYVGGNGQSLLPARRPGRQRDPRDGTAGGNARRTNTSDTVQKTWPK